MRIRMCIKRIAFVMPKALFVLSLSNDNKAAEKKERKEHL
jgi:hypothetical protein